MVAVLDVEECCGQESLSEGYLAIRRETPGVYQDRRASIRTERRREQQDMDQLEDCTYKNNTN